MFTLDGVELDDPSGRWWLNDRSRLRVRPPRLDNAASIPGREGAMPSLGTTFAPGTALLSLTLSQDDHADMMEGLELLYGLFSQRRRLLPLVHDYGNGQKRVAMVEVLSEVTPDWFLLGTTYVDVTLRVPDVFWRSESEVTATTPAVTASAATHTLSLLDGTAPIVDSLIRVKGAFSTLTLSDPVTGDQIKVNTPLTATQYIIIDTAKWTAHRVTTDTWDTSGGTDVSLLVESNRGRGAMLTLEPDQLISGGRYRLTVQATAPASTPVVAVRAKKSYF